MIYYIQRRCSQLSAARNGWLTLDYEGTFDTLTRAKEHIAVVAKNGETRAMRVIGVSEIHSPPILTWTEEKV